MWMNGRFGLIIEGSENLSVIADDDCPSRFFGTGIDCFPCADNCYKCQDKEICLLCEKSYEIIDKNCSKNFSPRALDSCFNGQYLDPTSNSCETCSAGCEICSSYSSCQSCYSGMRYDANFNTCTCPFDSYFDGGSSSCLPCNSPCQTCDS
jgi:proprotein convertase subtilisin/kexin type 5